MEPTLKAGEVVLVDRSDKVLRDGSMFAILWENVLRIRRVRMAHPPDGRDFQIAASKFSFLRFLDVVVVRLNHSGVEGVSGITRGASLAIVRSLSRSCGKKAGPPYKPLRNSVGATPTTRRKT